MCVRQLANAARHCAGRIFICGSVLVRLTFTAEKPAKTQAVRLPASPAIVRICIRAPRGRVGGNAMTRSQPMSGQHATPNKNPTLPAWLFGILRVVFSLFFLFLGIAPMLELFGVERERIFPDFLISVGLILFGLLVFWFRSKFRALYVWSSWERPSPRCSSVFRPTGRRGLPPPRIFRFWAGSTS
jgi:hypothetical protein